ncbi:MAG: VWA domain-containing protein [Acidobacteriota bacterium]
MRSIGPALRPSRLLAAAFLTLMTAVAPTVMAEGTASSAPLVLVLDASGSMWGQIDGENKIVIARRALGELVDDLPTDSKAALVAYGHRRKGDCADIETVVPMGTLDAVGMKSAVEALQPTGKTPISASVEQALGLVKDGGEGATVILLSDGLETCGGDPCRTVRLAKEAGAEMVLHVIGFDVEGEDLSQLQCMAQAGGGLFLGANDAAELGEALDRAVAQPVDVPVGRLVVHAVADGELADVSIHVSGPDGKEVAVGRTYDKADTNPRAIPLADGEYDVKVGAIRLEGDTERRFKIRIADGGVVEKNVDFSSGELVVGVTRNGELSDATVRIYSAEDDKPVETQRTYNAPKTNPSVVRLTAGRYRVEVKLLEVENKTDVDLGIVEVTPKGRVEVSHGFESGTLKIGALRGGERVDAVVRVIDPETDKTVDQSRTYTAPKSNPKPFELVPGRYRIHGKTIGKPKVELEAEVVVDASGEVVHDFEFDG